MNYDIKKVVIFVGLIILIVGAAAYFFFFSPQKYFPTPYNKTAGAKNSDFNPKSPEAKALLSKIDQLIVLPAGEDPVIATVSDKSKLESQPFFANAKNGDKVIIYLKAKKAYLYDPIANKIIDVGPVALPSQEAAAPTNPPVPTASNLPTLNPSPTLHPSPTVALNPSASPSAKPSVITP